jgi:hypothetical protein
VTPSSDVYGFLLDEPWCLPLESVLRLTDRQIFTLYNPPRDQQTGARKRRPAVAGWWRREDPAAMKAQFLAMAAVLSPQYTPAQLEELWAASRRKKGRKP